MYAYQPIGAFRWNLLTTQRVLHTNPKRQLPLRKLSRRKNQNKNYLPMRKGFHLRKPHGFGKPSALTIGISCVAWPADSAAYFHAMAPAMKTCEVPGFNHPRNKSRGAGEIMLAIQMAAVHTATIEVAHRLAAAKSNAEIESLGNIFTKLARTYATFMAVQQRCFPPP